VRSWLSCASLVLAAAVGLVACGGGAAEHRATPTRRAEPAGPRVQQLSCAAGFGTPKRQWFRARYPRWSLRIGPVTFLDVRRAAREPLARRGGEKLRVLDEPNRDVTIAIGAEARDAVGFVAPTNPFPAGPGAVPENAYAAVHLHGCPPIPREARVAPDVDGTFFATFIAIARNACVPFDVTPDSGRTIRRVVSLGAGRCT
jgi:hypothetical protein